MTSSSPEFINLFPGRPFKAVAALSLNRVIGLGNTIPWRLPEDFKWFKQTTIGNTLVMGRKTFESIGRPLPDRVTIVLSRSLFTHPGVRWARSWSEIQPAQEQGQVFVAGGAQIYQQALPWCSELLLTWVKRECEGDAFFPPFEDQFERVETIRETPEFDIVRYRAHLPSL